MAVGAGLPQWHFVRQRRLAEVAEVADLAMFDWLVDYLRVTDWLDALTTYQSTTQGIVVVNTVLFLPVLEVLCGQQSE